MSGLRSERVGELIRRELGMIMKREVDFPPGMLVTITDVAVDKKLGRAEVRVSVFPAASAAAAFTALTRQAGSLQHLLTEKLNIMPMPRISFALDRGPENAARVEKITLGK